ncbi:hypothetical protein ACGGZK_06750 [Agromyces sp. MMS24-K17]|uniref:hypothetical protein n=1 Tax=Agromyces sp. MMS24-K17 TaxID=3372850 RepID=UPI003754190E
MTFDAETEAPSARSEVQRDDRRAAILVAVVIAVATVLLLTFCIVAMQFLPHLAAMRWITGANPSGMFAAAEPNGEVALTVIEGFSDDPDWKPASEQRAGSVGFEDSDGCQVWYRTGALETSDRARNETTQSVRMIEWAVGHRLEGIDDVSFVAVSTTGAPDLNMHSAPAYQFTFDGAHHAVIAQAFPELGEGVLIYARCPEERRLGYFLERDLEQLLVIAVG